MANSIFTPNSSLQQGASLHGARKLDPCRLSFFDLPGELRNTIYQLLLLSITPSNSFIAQITPNALSLVLGGLCCWLREGGGDEATNRALMQNLNTLSLACHQVRKEARGFFFSRNDFCLFVRGMGRVVDYSLFLNAIGSEARGNLTFLALLRYKGDFRSCSRSEFDEFFLSLKYCTNVRSLRFPVPMEYFCPTEGNGDGLRDECSEPIEDLIYGSGRVPQFSLGPLIHTLVHLAHFGKLNCIAIDCRYEMPKSEFPRFLDGQNLSWKIEVRKFLRKELRTILPGGTVRVRIKAGTALGA